MALYGARFWIRTLIVTHVTHWYNHLISRQTILNSVKLTLTGYKPTASQFHWFSLFYTPLLHHIIVVLCITHKFFNLFGFVGYFFGFGFLLGGLYYGNIHKYTFKGIICWAFHHHILSGKCNRDNANLILLFCVPSAVCAFYDQALHWWIWQ